MTGVVDASVAVKWVVPERLSDEAVEVEARFEELLAPDLLLVEVANALWKKLRRRELSERQCRRALAAVSGGGVTLHSTAPLVARALELAAKLQHPVYDCVYLALAEREGAVLVTADARLLRATGGELVGIRIQRLGPA